MQGPIIDTDFETLRQQAHEHLLIQAETDWAAHPHRLEAGDELVVHITVANAFVAGPRGSVLFRNVELEVRGTEHAELLTWREDVDPPLLLAEELGFGEAVTTTVRLRILRAVEVGQTLPGSLVDLQVEADLYLGCAFGVVERRASLGPAPEHRGA